MANARMTLMGLYNYDPTLFNDLTFPSGINKELAVDCILLKCGESPVLYTNALLMKHLINNTGVKWYNNIERMLLAIESEYNPIHNYDRYEEWHDDDVKNESVAKTNNISESHDVTNTDRHDVTITGSATRTVEESGNVDTDRTVSNTDTLSKTTQNDVSAFNDSNFQPSSKTTESGTNTTSSTEGINTDTTNEQSINDTDNQRDAGERINRDAGNSTRNESGNNTLLTDNDSDHTGHLYGNIGTTTTQSMITDEMEMRKNINIYDVISEIFYKEICLYVY